MSRKRNRPNNQTRDAPSQSALVWLCSSDAYNILTSSGYTKLANCPEVRMCVDIYADLISNMTIYLMQNTAIGDIRVRNELSRKIDIEPNRLMTRKTFIYNIVRTMMLEGDGNQVTYVRVTSDGLIDNLEPFKPSGVSFIDTDDGYGYKIRYIDRYYDPDEVLHFVINPDPERPHVGTGYRAVLKDVVNGIKQANTTKKAILESPAPSIIVKVDGLTEEFASAEGRRKLGAQYLDASERGQPWFIPAEMFSVEQVKPLTLNDLAIKQNLEIDKRTVAGIFGVPPFLVGVGSFDREEYNNFISSRIMGKAKVIEQELTRKLLYSPDLYWKFNPRSLLSYSMQDVINAGSAMVDRMAMRRNEWRDWVGLSPDPEMDEILALENYIPANKLGDQKKLNGSGGDEGNGKGNE